MRGWYEGPQRTLPALPLPLKGEREKRRNSTARSEVRAGRACPNMRADDGPNPVPRRDPKEHDHGCADDARRRTDEDEDRPDRLRERRRALGGDETPRPRRRRRLLVLGAHHRRLLPALVRRAAAAA